MAGRAASGSDPISSLEDVATSGHNDAKGLTQESHPVGGTSLGAHFRPRCRIFLGSPWGLAGCWGHGVTASGIPTCWEV